ncbi:MAG: hypothetical protein LC792_26450 [Actinobacteria bacterium]|nr:hypothetical protein [Actinomycetota bacterium]
MARLGWRRRRRLSTLARAELPPGMPTVGDLYSGCGTDFELSLDIGDVAVAGVAVGAARAAGAAERLWLCHPDWEQLSAWRRSFPDVRLVNSTRLRAMRQGPERRAAQLSGAGIDAVNLHHTDWTGGLTTLFHRFGRLAFGWDAQHERVLRALLRMGVDAVYSDHVDRMVAVVSEA